MAEGYFGTLWCGKWRRLDCFGAGALRNDRKELALPTAVIARESGETSTPRLIHFIADVSGILGRPLPRTTTVEVVTSSAPFVVLPDHLHAVWTCHRAIAMSRRAGG
jgi:hypothetical protein